MACLVLKAYLKTTYRGVIDILDASDALRKRIGLKRLPNYSTLKKFADRGEVLQIIDCMLLDIVCRFANDEPEAAIDSTGLETTSASVHYRTRIGKTRKKYVKVSVCVMTESFLPPSVVPSWGPGNDKSEAPELLAKASHVNRPKTLLADAGYDAEWLHEFCRERWKVEA